MAFYVPLGPRGVLFRLGTFVIGVCGGLVYLLAYRRRTIILSNQGLFSAQVALGVRTYGSLELAASMPNTLVQAALLSEREAPGLV